MWILRYKGDGMKKNMKFLFPIYILVVSFVVIFFVGIFLDSKAKYPLYDCVTYFDNDARFQLIYVGGVYYLRDACKARSICSNIKYYAYKDEKVYVVYEDPMSVNGEVAYITTCSILYVNNGYFKKLDQTWDDIEIKEKDMIDLTKNRGPFIKFFLDLIPCRLRKV